MGAVLRLAATVGRVDLARPRAPAQGRSLDVAQGLALVVGDVLLGLGPVPVRGERLAAGRGRLGPGDIERADELALVHQDLAGRGLDRVLVLGACRLSAGVDLIAGAVGDGAVLADLVVHVRARSHGLGLERLEVRAAIFTAHHVGQVVGLHLLGPLALDVDRAVGVDRAEQLGHVPAVTAASRRQQCRDEERREAAARHAPIINHRPLYSIRMLPSCSENTCSRQTCSRASTW